MTHTKKIYIKPQTADYKLDLKLQILQASVPLNPDETPYQW